MNNFHRFGASVRATFGIIIVLLMLPAPAHAYIDPGIVGFLITTVLGFLAAIGYTLRGYWHRIKGLFSRKTQTSENEDDARSEN